jgi:hypothetical protein
VKDKEL